MNTITKQRKTLSSTEAQQNFGHLLSVARREPVVIQKNHHDVAVVISSEDYEEILQQKEDAYWAGRAEKAARGGFLSKKESEKYLNSVLNA